MSRFWVEISALDHGHGGPGWELGKCLWSPGTDRQGRDRYAIMREPRSGDHVFHIIRREHDRALVGLSFVAAPAELVFSPLPQPSSWSGFESYYRISLQDYAPVSPPPAMEEIEAIHGDAIRADITPVRPRHHPYNTYGSGVRVAQGMYLGALSNRMVEIFGHHCGLLLGENTAQRAPVDTGLFAEGELERRERNFFARHRGLRETALVRWGTICTVCAFDFSKAYGTLGAGFIEVHHLESLADKASQGGTSGRAHPWLPTHDVFAVAPGGEIALHRLGVLALDARQVVGLQRPYGRGPDPRRRCPLARHSRRAFR
jgi:hypothetical protein